MSYQDENMSYGEGIRGNGNVHSRREISNKIAISIQSQKVQEESDKNRALHEKLYGRDSNRISEIRRIGVNDRLNAVPYDPNKYVENHDINNYYEGFYNMGNRAIQGQIEMLSDEELQEIGRNDYVSGVKVESLPKLVRENVSYTEGYMMASIFGTEKGKGRR